MGPTPGRRRRWWWRPLAVYVASRLLVAVVAFAAVAGSDGDPGAGPWPALPAGGSDVARALARYDGAWYLAVAEEGYPRTVPSEAAAFFPLYPAAIRSLSWLPGVTSLSAALALSLGVGAVAAVLGWRLTSTVADAAAADRGVALLCTVPGSFVCSMAYSEPLLLAGAAACLLALVRRRWAAAGLAAAVASAARPNGIVLVAACAWPFLASLRRGPDWRSLWAPALAPLGALASAGYLWARTGDPLAWWRSQREAWGERLTLGSTVVERLDGLLKEAPSLGLRGLTDLVGTLGLVAVVLGLVCLVRWRPPAPLVLYTAGVLVLALTSYKIGFRPRFVFAAFPLVLAAGVVVQGRAFLALLAGSVVSGVALTAITLSTLAVTP